MNSDDNTEVKQENELSSLQAIFMEDLKDLRGVEVKNKWIPLNISITLTPPRRSSGSHEVHAKLDLHIICSQNYPNNVPIIQLENSSGLSHKALNILKGELESKAEKLVGEVMIFELCECIKKFLDEHNKPQTKSFHEQMLHRVELQKQEEQKAKEINKFREKQKLISEVYERKMEMEMENIHRKEARLSFENSSESDILSRFHSSCNDEDEILICDHLNTDLIEFSNNGVKRILRGRCISHSKHKCILYSGLDQENGKLYLVSEWTLNSEKQIAFLIQDMNYMVKLKHSNLVHYLNISYQILPEENKTVLYILQEFVFGLNCKHIYLSRNIAAEIDVIRNIAEGVLNALDFLHQNNVVHKDLSDSCVYVNRNGRIQVSNYNLHKRISDLVCDAQSSNYKKKIDIFKFGILILSLVKGCFIEEENIEIPKNIPSNLQDFLSHCFSPNERYTALELRNHSFLKVPLMRFSPLRNNEIKEPQRIESPEETADLNMIAYKAYGGQSRVEKEFKILDHLGKGAYGRVYKVL